MIVLWHSTQLCGIQESRPETQCGTGCIQESKHNVGQASNGNRDPKHNVGQGGAGAHGASNGNPTGNVDQPTPPAGIKTLNTTWGYKNGLKGTRVIQKSLWNVPWGSERRGVDKKVGDKSHIKRVVGKEKVDTKQQKDGGVFVSNERVFDLKERVFNSNERVSNEMIFNSNERGFNSNEMIFKSKERVFKSKEMVSKETGFRMNVKGKGFK
ncbi:hypothetical protein TNCV_3172991 [Trichonephila clavipes]|nr:hypothetical protein TNCV_3172991 [Trichonephila clavipes]